MKKLIKKIKKWLVHKLGAYTIDEIPTRNVALAVGKTVEPITLSVAVSTYTELFETETGLNYVKLRIKEALSNFALKELPKYMGYIIHRGLAEPYRIVRCKLIVVPIVDEKSLADLLADKKTEIDKEIRGI